MAPAGNLDRIAALTDLLVAIDGRQRGEPIEAEQWNTIVDVLRGILEIDRLQETGLAQSLADSYAPVGHEHLGQVSLAWLDADLQNRLVTGGGAGAVSVLGALTGVTSRLGDLSGTVSSLATRLDTIQQRTDTSQVDELTRSAKLRGFEARFTGVEDLGALVTSVSAQVQDLGPHVQTVLDLRSQLTTPDGLPIDVSGLTTRVAGLTTALDAATGGVDGSALRMRDLQIQIKELQDINGVGPGGLDQLIATLGAQLQGTLDTRLDERLGAQQADIAALIDQQLATFEQRFGELQQAVDAKIAEVADTVTQQVVSQVGDKIAAKVLDQVTGQVQGIVDERLKGALGKLNEVVNQLSERTKRLELKVFG